MTSKGTLTTEIRPFDGIIRILDQLMLSEDDEYMMISTELDSNQ